MGRPLVAGADGDRRDAGVLERLHVLEQLVPRRRRGVDAGLLEQRLVVPEADHPGVVGHAVLHAVDLVQPDRALGQVADEAGDVVGDVADEAGVDLLPQAATAPGLEQVGHVAGLQVGLQGGLEGLVLHHRDVDLDVGVLGHEGVGHGLPVREPGIVVLDVPPVDLDGVASGRGVTGRGFGGGRRGGLGGVGGAIRRIVVVTTGSGDEADRTQERKAPEPPAGSVRGHGFPLHVGEL